MMELILGSLFLAFVFVLSTSVRRYDGYFSPVAIIGFSIFIYVIGIPIETSLTGHRHLEVGPGIDFSSSLGRHAIMLAFVAYASFYVGYRVAVRTPRGIGVSRTQFVGVREATRTTVQAGVTFTIVVAVAFPQQILSSRSYGNAYAERFQNPLYSAGIIAAMILLAMGSFLLLHSGHRLGAASLLTVLAVWGVFSNSKAPLALGVMAVASNWFAYHPRNRSRNRFIWALILGPFVIGAATLAFSINRGGGQVGPSALATAARQGLFTGTEPAGPFWSIVAEVKAPGSSGSDKFPGQTVLEAFVGWIPRAVWPGRPTDLALAFAQTQPGWSPGVGSGYSPIAEGLLQGGLVGLVLFFALVGLAVGLSRNLLLKPRQRPGLEAILSAYYCTGFSYALFIFLRAPLQSFVISVAQGVFVTLILLMLHRNLTPRADAAANASPEPQDAL